MNIISWNAELLSKFNQLDDRRKETIMICIDALLDAQRSEAAEGEEHNVIPFEL